MSLPTFNTKSPTIKRILKEAHELRTHPDPTLHASPLDSNLFEWHFTLTGPPGTPYSAGAYHGRIILPPTYPLRPPSFRFLTPSGRFEVNREICLSISGHHEETWQPAWGIRTALWALRAFMEGGSKGQVGGMEMGGHERRRLAQESWSWRCLGCGGRTNGETLKEEGGTGEGEKVAGGGELPAELKFGYRDEMEKGKEGTEREVEKRSDQQPLLPTDTTNQPTTSPPSSTASFPPSTQQQHPTPTRTTLQPSPLTSLSAPSPLSSQAYAAQTWIDKAIIALVAALLLMVIKKTLS